MAYPPLGNNALNQNGKILPIWVCHSSLQKKKKKQPKLKPLYISTSPLAKKKIKLSITFLGVYPVAKNLLKNRADCTQK